MGKPALQSSRLIAAEYTTTMSKTLLKRLAVLLKDLGIPEKLLPTQAICDLYDKVLLILFFFYVYAFFVVKFTAS